MKYNHRAVFQRMFAKYDANGLGIMTTAAATRLKIVNCTIKLV